METTKAFAFLPFLLSRISVPLQVEETVGTMGKIDISYPEGSGFAWAKFEKDGFTGRKIANHLGITEGYLSMILRGKRTPEETIKRAIEAVNDFPNLKHP